MSDVSIKLRADSVEEFLDIKIKFYHEAWEKARQEALDFFEGRLKKTWWGLLLRPFTEKEKKWLVDIHFNWASRYYTDRLEKILVRAQWSKTGSGGFNEVYMTTYEFEDFISDAPNKVEEYIRDFKQKIRNLSVLADPV